MKIAICGSMSSAASMVEVKEKLEKQGHAVILPENCDTYIAGTMIMENKQEKIANNSIKKHFAEIDSADAILVVNVTKNGIDNYIGGNAFLEIGFAYVLNKKIFLLNPIPRVSFSDEIEAMFPVILNNDLGLVA